MTRTRIFKATLAAAVFTTVAGTAACRGGNDEKSATPTAQIATQTPEQRIDQPLTVDGCLRAGEGGTTFVLTTAQTETGGQVATYHLASAGNVNLGDHVGERVRITGQLETQQHASTQTPATTAGKPTGTAGTPTVSTETDLTVRTMDVSSVQPLGSRCDQDK